VPGALPRGLPSSTPLRPPLPQGSWCPLPSCSHSPAPGANPRALAPVTLAVSLAVTLAGAGAGAGGGARAGLMCRGFGTRAGGPQRGPELLSQSEVRLPLVKASRAPSLIPLPLLLILLLPFFPSPLPHSGVPFAALPLDGAAPCPLDAPSVVVPVSRAFTVSLSRAPLAVSPSRAASAEPSFPEPPPVLWRAAPEGTFCC